MKLDIQESKKKKKSDFFSWKQCSNSGASVWKGMTHFLLCGLRAQNYLNFFFFGGGWCVNIDKFCCVKACFNCSCCWHFFEWEGGEKDERSRSQKEDLKKAGGKIVIGNELPRKKARGEGSSSQAGCLAVSQGNRRRGQKDAPSPGTVPPRAAARAPTSALRLSQGRMLPGEGSGEPSTYATLPVSALPMSRVAFRGNIRTLASLLCVAVAGAGGNDNS